MRNEAFHRELMNEEILEPTTELLFLTVVELARDFPVHSYGVPGGTPSGENAKFMCRFGSEKPYDLASQETKAKIYAKLIEGVAIDWTLANKLSEDMTNRLDEILNGLAYVNDEETDYQKLEHILRYAQFWREKGAEVMRKSYEAGKVPKDELDAAFAQWSKSPGPRYTIEKVKRNRVHATAIAKMANPADALARYSAIEKWMAPLEADISRAVIEYEQHIDAMIEEQQLRRAFQSRK